MNKSELVRAVSKKTGSTVKYAENFLNAFVETMIESIAKGDDVTLAGFGRFSLDVRTAVNLKTKEIIKVPSSKAVKFKAGKKLKDRVYKK